MMQLFTHVYAFWNVSPLCIESDRILISVITDTVTNNTVLNKVAVLYLMEMEILLITMSSVLSNTFCLYFSYGDEDRRSE